MPTAYNEKTGELLVLGPEGWTKPQMAQNPQTGEKVYMDGKEWKAVPSTALGTPEENRARSAFDGPLSRATDVLRQGATLGFSDEIGAALSTPVPFLKNLPQGLGAASEAAGKRYDDVLAYERAKLKEFKQESPVSSALLETAGGLVLGPSVTKAGAAAAPLKPPPAAGMPSLASTMGKTAAGAATVGGIAGFGGGEGGFGNRVEDAATTGVIAGLVGGATPLALKAAGGAGDLIGNLFGRGNADEQANKMVLRALQRDAIDPATLKPGTKPEALVDLGGENVRGLMRGAATLPGPARQMTQDFVATRQAGQGARIADDVATAISPNANYASTIDDLMASRARAAQPLYERVVRPDSLVPDEKFASLAQDPYIAQAIGKVRENPLYGMADLPPNSLPVLDATKKQLDDLIGAAKRSGANNEARLLTQKKDQIVSLADEAFPDYRLAREAWSGPTQSAEAMELGRNILKESSEITAKAIKSLPQGDKEFFKAGVVRAIKDAADNTQDGADITKRFFGRPAMREKLRAAFDNDASFKAFEDAIAAETRMYTNAQQINPRFNSKTGMVQEDTADIRKNPVVQFATDIFTQGPFKATGNIASNLYDRGRGINQGTSEALARMLLETDPAKLQAITGQLSGQKATDIQRAREIARQLGLIGRAEGAAVGSF